MSTSTATAFNFEADTTVESVGEHRYRGQIVEGWDNWGPIGGYVATILVRAAAAETDLTRLASVHCQFTKPAAYDALDIEVTTTKRSRRAHAMRVTGTQEGEIVAEASVWFVTELTSEENDWIESPTPAPDPSVYPALDELMEEIGGWVMPAWKDCYEIRLAHGSDVDPARPAGDPLMQSFLRMRNEQKTFDDPVVEACRAVFVADIVQFPAITQGFAAADINFMAPTLDLYVAIHAAPPPTDWLIVEGIGSASGEGLMSARANVFSGTGELIATSSQQMLVRKFG